MTLFRLHMVKQILPSGRIVSWSPWSSWKCLPSLRSCKNLSGWPRTSRNYLPAPGRIIYYRRPSVGKWARLPETVEAEKMAWLDLPRGTSYPTFPYPRCYLKARRYPPTSAAPVSIVGMAGGGGAWAAYCQQRQGRPTVVFLVSMHYSDVFPFKLCFVSAIPNHNKLLVIYKIVLNQTAVIVVCWLLQKMAPPAHLRYLMNLM